MFVIIWIRSPIKRFIFLVRLVEFCKLCLFNLINLGYRLKNFFFRKMNVNKVFYDFNLSSKLFSDIFYKGFVKETFLVFVGNKNDVA